MKKRKELLSKQLHRRGKAHTNSKRIAREEKRERSLQRKKKIYVPERTTAAKITGHTHNLNLIMERMS